MKKGALFLPLALVAAFATFSGPSHAGTLAQVEAVRLSAAGHSMKWTQPMRGHRYGHAETLIRAPIGDVRKVITAYGQYKNLAPDRFQTSQKLAMEGDRTKVFFRFLVLKGALTISTTVLFQPPKAGGNGSEIVEGSFVSGDFVDSAHVLWTATPVDSEFTVLKCDLFLKPSFPAPDSAIDEELRDAAERAVDSVHDRVQGKRDFLKWQPPG